MKNTSIAAPPRSRALPALATALALAACGGGDLLPQPEAGHLATCPQATSTSPASADTLTAVVAEPALSAEQAQRLREMREWPPAAEIHLARLAANADVLLRSGRALTLQVAPGRSLTVRGERRVPEAADYLHWTGEIAGGAGRATLALSKTGLTGNVQGIPTATLPATYTFAPLGGGLHAVTCVDIRKIPPD